MPLLLAKIGKEDLIDVRSDYFYSSFLEERKLYVNEGF